MPKAYVSSTYKDLSDYRRVAIETLHQLRFDVSAMEKYVASDERPLEMCLADVAQCDLYIGIVAWRYGYVPQANNPEKQSITECEWREAVRLCKPCLLFLSEDQPDKWPNSSEEDLSHVREFREVLGREHYPGRYHCAESLGRAISVAVWKLNTQPDFGRYLASISTEFAELPPIPNGGKSLPVGDAIKLRVSFSGKPKNENGEECPSTTILDLLGAVPLHRAWFLVGDAGQGKSTALRSLAYQFAREWLDADQCKHKTDQTRTSPFVPVYIMLSRHPKSLKEQIWTALQRPDFRCSMDQLDNWMRSQPFLFLLDRLDETQADSVIEDLQVMASYATNCRFVVASRPMMALQQCPWPQGRIEYLSHSKVLSLLATLLGTTRGSELCDKLVTTGLLEAFRRPLFVHMLALCSPILLAQDRFTSSEVFADVLERQFLGTWERKTGTHLDRQFIRELVSWVAHEMIARDAHELDWETIRKKGVSFAGHLGIHGDMRYVSEQLDGMVLHGIVQIREEQVQFWHSSFRDYFAGIWLGQHTLAVSIWLRSWQPRWHSALLFYFGRLRGNRLKARLRDLLVGSRAMIALLSLNSYENLTHRLFFVLRCLVQAGSEYKELQKRFIAVCPLHFSHFYLHLYGEKRTNKGSSSRYWGEAQQRFCDLIGQFRIPDSFAYLNRVETCFPIVAAGLIHESDDSISQRVVAWLVDFDQDSRSETSADPDTGRDLTGYLAVAEIIIRSPDDRFVAPMLSVFAGGAATPKSNLLSALISWFIWSRSNDDDDGIMRLTKHLQATLVDMVLWQEDEGVGALALSLLQKMKDGSGGRDVPAVAKAAFFDALNSPIEKVRSRALTGLLWTPLSERKDIAWQLLRDPSVGIVCQILDFIQIFDRVHLPVAALRVVRRHAPKGSPLRELARHFAADSTLGYPGSKSRRQSVALLIAAADFGKYNFLRLYSVVALGDFRLPWTVPMLLRILRSDEWVHIRCAALGAVTRILGKKATELVVKLLDTSETEILETAVRACRGAWFDAEWRPYTGHKLFRLLDNPSNLIGGSAARTLEEWGYLDKEWNWYLYKDTYLKETEYGVVPTYLGPTSADSFVVPDGAGYFEASLSDIH